MLKCHFLNISYSYWFQEACRFYICPDADGKLSIAENYIIAQAHCIILMYHIVMKVSYKLSYLVGDENSHSLKNFE